MTVPANEDPPYWKRHYGMYGPWRGSDAVRRGCISVLVVVLILLAGFVVLGLWVAEP